MRENRPTQPITLPVGRGNTIQQQQQLRVYVVCCVLTSFIVQLTKNFLASTLIALFKKKKKHIKMKTQRYLSDCLFCNCVTEFPVQIRNDGGEHSVTVIQEQGRQLR